MRKDGQQGHPRWRQWTGGILLIAVVVTVVVFYPRALRGPQTVAREFIEAMIQAPGDAERLRRAGHLADTQDVQALVDGLSARVALEFLQAREQQGVTHQAAAVQWHRTAPKQYTVKVRVTEPDGGGNNGVRQFVLSLTQLDSGDWRVTAVSVDEKK